MYQTGKMEKIMISIFFSPRGTTKKTARAIAGHEGPVQERDLLGRPLTEDLTVPAEEPVLPGLAAGGQALLTWREPASGTAQAIGLRYRYTFAGEVREGVCTL